MYRTNHKMQTSLRSAPPTTPPPDPSVAILRRLPQGSYPPRPTPDYHHTPGRHDAAPWRDTSRRISPQGKHAQDRHKKRMHKTTRKHAEAKQAQDKHKTCTQVHAHATAGDNQTHAHHTHRACRTLGSCNSKHERQERAVPAFNQAHTRSRGLDRAN